MRVHNIRDYTHDKHHMTDDTPYGGGGGTVMKPEPVFEAIETVLGLIPIRTQPEPFDQTQDKPASNIPIILLTPQGRVFNQSIAQELSQHRKLSCSAAVMKASIERIREHLVTDEISIGDYVLTGGELPALILSTPSHASCLMFWATPLAHRMTGMRWVCSNIRITHVRPISRLENSRRFTLRRPCQNR